MYQIPHEQKLNTRKAKIAKKKHAIVEILLILVRTQRTGNIGLLKLPLKRSQFSPLAPPQKNTKNTKNTKKSHRNTERIRTALRAGNFKLYTQVSIVFYNRQNLPFLAPAPSRAFLCAVCGRSSCRAVNEALRRSALAPVVAAAALPLALLEAASGLVS